MTNAKDAPEHPFDPGYYMTEACGIFAVALSRTMPGGSVWIMSRKDGEPWSRSVPEITHVLYLAPGERAVDAKGFRSPDDMAADFDMDGKDWRGSRRYNLLGPFSAPDFQRKSMGNSDRKPLYGGAMEIDEAEGLVRLNPGLFGVPLAEAPQTAARP